MEDNILRKGVTHLIHASDTAGHPGTAKTLALLNRNYWWPGMKNFATQYVKGCALCQFHKNITTQPKPPQFPITTNPEAQPFECIALDFITKLLPSEGYNSILTITDHNCSKGSIFIPCKETIDAIGVAELYSKHVFPHYGLPQKVISNRDPRFTATTMKELCRNLNIKQNISTTYHPQMDGQSERTNQWLEQYLQIFGNGAQTDWSKWLPLAQYTHNTWPSATTGKSPFELIMGHVPYAHIGKTHSLAPTIDSRLTQTKAMRQAAQQAITHAQQIMIRATKYRPFEEGQKVWLEATHLKTTHPTAKLSPRRYGPFKITRKLSHVVYQLRIPQQWKIHDIFHVALLTPYKEMEEHGPNYHEPPPDIIKAEPEWEVEQIVGARCFGRSRRIQYWVRWTGYSDAHDTWETVDDVHALQLTVEFWKGNQALARRLAYKLTPISKGQNNSLSISLMTTHGSDQRPHSHPS